MLEFKNGKYLWDGVSYDSFKEALSHMCNEITSDGIAPKFGDLSGCRLGHKELQQYVLLYAIYNMDVSVLMQCANAEQYRRATGKGDSRVLPLLKQSNPIYMKVMTLPMGYASNKAMQCVLLPQLSKTYQLESRSIPLKRGKFPYEVVLSYLCDTVLFNPHNTPFTKGLDVFTVLGNDPRTDDLDTHAGREDYDKLRVLSAQLKAGDITTPIEEFITIGDVKKGRYSYASRDWFPKENVIEMLLECPPSLQSDDYLTWLASAAAARGYSQEEIRSVCSVHESFIDNTPIIKAPTVKDEPVSVHPSDVRKEATLTEEATLPPIEPKVIADVTFEGESVDRVMKYIQSNGMTVDISPVVPPLSGQESKVLEVIDAPEDKDIDVLASADKATSEEVAGILVSAGEKSSDAPTQNDLDMAVVAQVYCTINEVPYEQTIKELNDLGVTVWEDVNRALPVYLRRNGHNVDVTVLTEYSRSLDKYYGGFELKSDF